MAIDQPKRDRRDDGLPRDRRDRPVEEEADKDIKEGGMEQAERRDRHSREN